VQALLKDQREHEHERPVAQHEGQVQRESAAHGAEAEYRGREERYQSPSFRPALDPDRGRAEHWR